MIGQKIINHFSDYQKISVDMATKGPPRKKVKQHNTLLNEENNKQQQEEILGTVIAQLKSTDGEIIGAPLSLPANVTSEQLELLVNQLLSNVISQVIYSVKNLN